MEDNIIHTHITTGDARFKVTLTKQLDTDNESMRWIAGIDNTMIYVYGDSADYAFEMLRNKIRKMLPPIFGQNDGFIISNTEKDLKDALEDCLDALIQVQKNQEYQSKRGFPNFTSAPTEIEWKKDCQSGTDKIVEAAIYKATRVLEG